MNEQKKNAEEATEPRGKTSSRFGREAKIGMTMILALLIVLTVVVVRRLTASKPDEMAATPAADREQDEKEKGKDRERDKWQDNHRNDSAGRENKSGLLGSHQTTVVPAKAGPAKPPSLAAGDSDRWKFPGDKSEKTGPAGSPERNPLAGSAHMTPPSFSHDSPHHDSPGLQTSSVSDLPKPPRAEPFNRYGSESWSRASHEGTQILGPVGPAITVGAPDPARGSPAADPPAEHASRRSDVAGYQRTISHEPSGAVAISPDPMRPERSHNELGRGTSTRSRHVGPASRREDGKYEVEPNDSYWTISERLYGTGAYFKALAARNRGKGANEDQLKPGELIEAPPVAQLEQAYPDLCPKPGHREPPQSKASTVSTRQSRGAGRAYTVVEGDTLFNIARYELGKASRWAEIYDLNRDVLGKDFNYLTPGTQLVLPQGEKGDMQARQPDNGYKR